ncbi:formate dehydrogenase accessory protein FdhE [Roseomonas sp. OT10]|uniref:formate dehydrogenase accessory protein FdhE n=1 Tax=Roseomonas cutis TaxID=2897332 RepID=UPI001E5D325C|nr:formate dehydrogenase accessory protein FdhE [Roseomonas sp. OT10]UFN47763.1 formate dehydrogenase accessory protein FdhE [Roseomonas sp. OT10]
MSGFQNIQPDPSMIGRLAQPPYALLPDPAALFRLRAERFARLAQSGDLAPYLTLLGQLCAIQSALAAELPAVDPLPAAQVERARENAMPPIDRAALLRDPLLRETVTRFLDAAAAIPMPAPAAAALDALRHAAPAELDGALADVLSDAVPFEALPQYLFLAAAVQIHAARLAATLEAGGLVRIGHGVCPACGGPPVASLVVAHQGAEGARYAACSCCGTHWNEVRITCLACGSTKGIGYRSPEEDDTVKAEVCDSCRSWVKILYQNRNAALEAVADDVASLGLDLLMRETEYSRAGFDPFLLGY